MELKLKIQDQKTIDNIIYRAHYLLNQMIFMANNRKDKEKGDPKVGGHSSASSGALHILAALHLFVKSGFDHICNKPHASPADHSLNYLLDLFLNEDLSKLTLEECNHAMSMLRAFPKDNEYVFQSYHSAYDADYHNFLPTGTVGIPPVNIGYLAHAYRFAKKQGYNVPDAHFWALMGDAEFREGSLFEAIPDFAERELGNVTWIVDYNRQSLDGTRITNQEIMYGTDADRIGNTMLANGWDVIQVRHGSFRNKLFNKKGGEAYQQWLEKSLTDFEYQTLLLIEDPKELKDNVSNKFKELSDFLKNVSDEDFYKGLHDIGGNDIMAMIEALEKSKKNPKRPCMIVAHTIKGWHLKMAATSGNHSALPNKAEMDELRQAQGISDDVLFARFDDSSAEGKFLKQRSEKLYQDIKDQHKIKADNEEFFKKEAFKYGEMNDTLDINLKMASYPHTQWMLGQLTAKLTRISNTPVDETKLLEKQKPLTDAEKIWKLPAEMLVPMAPDVGTSTNLNPAMDGKVFGPENTDDWESEFNVKDKKRPDLVPGNDVNDRFIRFDIAEANVMSCMGSYGKIREILGIPLLPLMTVYDFFVKRALDQFFYNLYWKSSFIMVGTPSGVTLSPEGAQHGWKSDIQIPNQITWEPFYCQELDWIFAESIKRHMLNDNEGRNGVFIRGVTRGADQKAMLKLLKTQKRFKTNADTLMHHKSYALPGAVDESSIATVSDAEIMNTIKDDVLNGAYYLINYEGFAGYEPGDNVVNIFALGSLTTEAIKASHELLEKGIYANVIVITCTDLLVGNLAHQDNYNYLRNELGVNADLYLQPMMNGSAKPGEVSTLAGRRIPIVSVHDGEPGLLDNIGSIVGVKQESLAVRKHSRCGRPKEIYKYHKIDSDAVVEACGKALSETALEQVKVSQQALQGVNQQTRGTHWKELWPKVQN